jgi:hypothetical protein
MKWILAVLVFAGATVHAQLTSGDFSYSINNSNWITLTAYTGSGGSVVIPETISGMPVRSIGASAFANKVNVTGISLPSNLVTISDAAFYNTRIYSVVVPNNVTSIGASAFSACANLNSVSLPDSLNYIGDSAFWGTPIISINIPTQIKTLKASTFYNCNQLQSLS